MAPCSPGGIVSCDMVESYRFPFRALRGLEPAHGVLHLCLCSASSEACLKELTYIWSRA